MLASRKQMLARTAVLLRQPACVCMSASDTRAPVSVSGRLEKESARCLAPEKANENKTQNPDSRSRHRRAKVRKTCMTGCVPSCLLVYSELNHLILPTTY